MESEPSPEGPRYAGKTEAALHYMCLNAWANDSAGDVRSIYGRFYRISNSSVELGEIVDAFASKFQELGVDPTKLVGHFLVVEHPDAVTVTGFPDEDWLMAAWDSRVTDWKVMEHRRHGER